MHINKINGKKYIGITSVPVKYRWGRGSGYAEHLPIGRAIRKYGWDNFEHLVILENLDEDEAKRLEIELIREWKTQDDQYGYNICAGGDGVTGWHPSEETKKKQSAAAISLHRYGERNPNYGHCWTAEMRNAASERKKGNVSEETRRKMSESAKKRIGDKNPFYGKTHSDETKKKLAELRHRRVKQIDQSGNVIGIYNSIKEAAKSIGMSGTAISNCCRGKTKTCHGYKWEYAEV